MPLVLDGTNGVSGVDGTASNPAIEGTDSNTGIFYPAADTVAIGTGGTEALRVNSSQNVGVGTSASGGRFMVRPSTDAPNTIQLLGDGNTLAGSIGFDNATGGVGNFRLLANNAMTFTTNGSERMRLDASGNLIVGGTSASGILTLGNSSKASTTAISVKTSTGDNSFGTQFGAYGALASGDAYIYAPTSGTSITLMADNATGTIKFASGGNAERARITSGGVLLVGTTTGQQNTEIAAFTNAGGGSVVLRIQRGGENNAYIGSSTAQPFQVYDSGIVQRFVVTSAGTCLNTTGTYGTLSDAKLKENIVDATPKLDDLMKVKVRNYELKSEPNSKYLGFVAQELREIFPAMIDETEDEDDNGEKTGEVTLSVKTTVFIPMLVKAIQELNAKVEAQAAEIAALKGNA